MRVRHLALIFAIAATTGLAACGGDAAAPNAVGPLARQTETASPGQLASPTTTWPATATPTWTGSATPTTTATPTATPTVKTGTVAGRQVLVDQDGRSLYIFTKDTPKVSTCVDQCSVTWPPLTGTAKAGEGGTPPVEQTDLGTISRPDGQTQVTYYEKPLYYYSTDKAPGDANGQGIGGVWFLVDVNGEPVK